MISCLNIFFQVAAKEVTKVYNDDGTTETEEFRILCQVLQSQTEQYDITKAKLVRSLSPLLIFFLL